MFGTATGSNSPSCQKHIECLRWVGPKQAARQTRKVLETQWAAILAAGLLTGSGPASLASSQDPPWTACHELIWRGHFQGSPSLDLLPVASIQLPVSSERVSGLLTHPQSSQCLCQLIVDASIRVKTE